MEMSVDSPATQSDQQIDPQRAGFTPEFSFVYGNTQSENHSDPVLNSKDYSNQSVITKQPPPIMSENVGPSGHTNQLDTVSKGHSSHSTQGEPLHSGPDQTSELPGQAQNTTGQYDGATGMSSQDPEKMKLSECGMQDPQCSTPEAAVLVQIECSLKEKTQKWEIVLKKSLQSLLFSKDLPDNTELCHLDISPSNPFVASVVLNSMPACEILLNKKSVQLKLKDINEEATVHFKTKVPLEGVFSSGKRESSLLVATPSKKHGSSVPKSNEIPMTVNAVVDVLQYGEQLANELLGKFQKHKTGPHTLTVTGTFEDVEEFYKELRRVVGSPVTSKNSLLSEHTDHEKMESSLETMRVPLFQYWYLNHVHRKEIERIQEKHGVTFKADVCVSVNDPSKTNHKSFTDAYSEFQKLFVDCTSDLDSFSVTNVDFLVKEIKNLDVNLMLNASAQNWCLIGPRRHVAAAKIMLQVPPYANDPKPELPDREHFNKTQNQNFNGESRWSGPRGVEMDVKDSVLTSGLHMSEVHWELMKKTFNKQIKDLENKFVVSLHETKSNDKVTITAQSNGNQVVNLEVNALRALMSLYQKAVMTTMCCSSKNASLHQAESFQTYLRDIREQKPSLVVKDEPSSSGVWKMIGFPEHLCFAVSEIERRFRAPVFDDEQKDMIGYAIRNPNVEFLRSFNDKPERSKGYGSSVDGATSSDLNGEDRPEGTGRKETHRFGNHKEAETEGGFKGGPHDRTAQPVGTDGEGGTKRDGGGGSKEDDTCPICMDEFNNKEKLPCGHGFCKDCLRQSKESMGAKCPVCTKVFGKIEGDQPDGRMTSKTIGSSLPGYYSCGTIVIDYNIPSGIQTNKHPKPGRPFHGAHRTAYLPNNKEGKEVLALLRRAFDQRLIFTVGTSRTSGSDDCVTWNDVHHKTSTQGGPQSFGYPDDTYLKRVREELKAKGIE